MNLVVSSGATVPNVVGLTQAAATTAITGAGLSVGTVTTACEHHGACRHGHQSEPDSGAQVALGQCRQLRGLDRRRTVPNVVGLTQAAATTAITGAGLTWVR